MVKGADEYLRRLVYHGTDVGCLLYIDDKQDTILESRDFSIRCVLAKEDVPLGCLELAMGPEYLQPILLNSAAQCSLKLIHLRVRRPGSRYLAKNFLEAIDKLQDNDFNALYWLEREETGLEEGTIYAIANFADWAFGPLGLPNLKAVAYGDFANGYMGAQLVFGRNSLEALHLQGHRAWRFLVMTRNAEYGPLLDEINCARQMLSACPTEPTSEMSDYAAGNFAFASETSSSCFEDLDRPPVDLVEDAREKLSSEQKRDLDDNQLALQTTH